MKTKYTFVGNSKVTATFADQTNKMLWVAFLGSNNECVLKKCSAFNPNFIYFTLTMTANEIFNLDDDSAYLFGAIDSGDYLGFRISKNTPLSGQQYIDIPVGINESAIDLVKVDDYIYFLIPGNLSGENAKIVVINNPALSYNETIDLSKSGDIVLNARKIDIDYYGNLWVISETDPVKLTKVVPISGGWDFETFTLS